MPEPARFPGVATVPYASPQHSVVAAVAAEPEGIHLAGCPHLIRPDRSPPHCWLTIARVPCHRPPVGSQPSVPEPARLLMPVLQSACRTCLLRADLSILLSLVVPTFRERANIAPLVQRLDAALADVNYEVVIMDDNSQDGTEELVAELSGRYPVRLVVRKDKRGLASAVIDGFPEAHGDIIGVMDAIYQPHRPYTAGGKTEQVPSFNVTFAVN